MKAIGARNLDIALIFMFESGIMGIIGGVIGIIFGVILSKGIEFIAFVAGVSNLAPYFSIELIVGTILFSFLLGIFAGTFPAINASKLNPVEILREE
jgi:putative ABC transport system permease protein